MCTTKNAPKLAALHHNPAVALTIDTEVHPPKIISGKKVEHSYVGVQLDNSTTSTPGAEIGGSGTTNSQAVVPGSPAAKAGLVQGDVITKVNDTPITTADGFISVIGGYKPGQTVTLTVVSPNGKTSTVKITLGVRPASVPTAG